MVKGLPEPILAPVGQRQSTPWTHPGGVRPAADRNVEHFINKLKHDKYICIYSRVVLPEG